MKQFRKLHNRKYREATGTFLLEGSSLLKEALKAKLHIVYAAYTNNFQQSKNSTGLFTTLSSLKIPLSLINDKVMAAITTLTTPPGIIAIARTPQNSISLAAPLSGSSGASTLTANSSSLMLLLEGIQDPGNLGTIIRTSYASGCLGIAAIKGTVDFYNPKVVRGSMGALFHLPCESSWSLEQVRELKQQGFQIIATVPQTGTPYWKADLRGPIALLLGNEAQGVSKEALTIADKMVTIPLNRNIEDPGGGIGSLNVAVAAGILLFDAKRQQTL